MLHPTLGDPAVLRAEHLEQWRHASREAMRAYRTWSGASRSDRHALYVAFLDALRREEQAAARVERDASAETSH